MAQYAISQNGIAALEKLAADLSRAMEEIEENSNGLLNVVNSLEPDLGIYYKEILMLVREVLKTVITARDGDCGINFLIYRRIPDMISRIEEMIRLGLGSADDDEAPQEKDLVLRKR